MNGSLIITTMMKMFIPFKSNTKSILSVSVLCGLVLSAINIYESTKQGLIVIVPPVVVVPGGGNGNMNSDNNVNNKREGIMTHYDQMNNNINKRNLLLHHQTPSVSSSSSSNTTTNNNNVVTTAAVASSATTNDAAKSSSSTAKKDNHHHHHQPVKIKTNNNNKNNNAIKRLISKSSSLTAATTTTTTATTNDNHQQQVNNNNNNNNNNNVVVSSSSMMKDNNNNNNKQDNAKDKFNFKGYDGYPRVVLAGGCAGSTATVDFMIKILEAHNFKLGGHEYEIMKPEKNWQYWYAEQRLLKKGVVNARTPKHIYYQMVIVDAIRYLNNEDYKNNSTMLFKLDTPNFRYKQYIQNQFYYHNSAEGLNVKFSHMYRGNPLDELICTIRDCFFNPSKANNLGYPVFAINGTKSIHFCFQRRFHPEIKIKAYLNPNLLKDELESRMKHTLKLKNEFVNITSPGISQSNEDIFAFEYTPAEKIFDMSVIAWSNMLRSLLTTTNPITGEIIDLLNKTIISDTLRPYQNTIKQKPHSAVIYNIDEITSVLKGTEYERFLRQ